jgi:cytochrome c553
MKEIILLFIISVSLFAGTTMCYKKNYSDITNVEFQTFDGGKCQGSESIDSMKAKGWMVDDIKIKNLDNGNYDFVYILKQKSKNNSVSVKNDETIDYEKLAQKTEEYKKDQQAKSDYKLAVEKYKIHCANCHGKNGELEPYNTSRKLTQFNKEEFVYQMYEYRYGDLDRGKAYLMRPSAPFTNELLDGYIYEYIQNQNK